MKLTTAYRVPYGSTPIVRSGATAPLSGKNLGRAIVLTQLVLMTLCGARGGGLAPRAGDDRRRSRAGALLCLHDVAHHRGHRRGDSQCDGAPGCPSVPLVT